MVCFQYSPASRLLLGASVQVRTLTHHTEGWLLGQASMRLYPLWLRDYSASMACASLFSVFFAPSLPVRAQILRILIIKIDAFLCLLFKM